MRKKIILGSLIIIVVIGGVLTNIIFSNNKGFIPENGVIPDETTAIKIAEAIWLPIYGEDIYNSQPFIAEYNKVSKIWYVYGTLPPDYLGGVPEIKISKTDGRVTYINHSK